MQKAAQGERVLPCQSPFHSGRPQHYCYCLWQRKLSERDQPRISDPGVQTSSEEARLPAGTPTQKVNVSNLSADINAEVCSYSLKGWLGRPPIRMTTRKLPQIPEWQRRFAPYGYNRPVLAVDPSSVTGMVQRSKSAAVPRGARSISVLVTI
jgi:hypothetical protein